VIEITRLVGTSAATFYQYFRGTEDAVLCLAEQVSEEMPGILAEIAGSWRGEPGLEKARRIVDAFIRYWDEHRTVLRARNLASEEGDSRFQALRSRTMSPVIQELARAIEAHRRKARPKAHALAAAAAMATILERIAAFHRELEGFGMTRSDLVESSAEILHRTVTGE
jgi:AcrR family transcriptional regulator